MPKLHFSGANYAFVRSRRRDVPIDRQDIAHLWEFSGSRELTTQLCRVQNLFIASKHVDALSNDASLEEQRGQVTTAVVVIVVDLSKPCRALESGNYWMETIRHRRDATFEKLRSRGSKLPEQLIARSRKLAFARHADRDGIDHSGLALVIAATKYDALKTHSLATQKV